MQVKPDETGVVRVRGQWCIGGDHIELPHCAACGKPQSWYPSNLPRDWHQQEVLVTVRLVKDDE